MPGAPFRRLKFGDDPENTLLFMMLSVASASRIAAGAALETEGKRASTQNEAP
jgi:hypothetical protein